MNAFGKRLRELRTERKVRQGAFAGACQISPAYLSDIENGKRNPPADRVILEWAGILDPGRAEEVGKELIGLAARDRGQAEAITEAEVVEAQTIWRRGPERGEEKTPEKSRTPFLDHFCEDLTARARQGRLDPAPGRARELAEIACAIARRGRNSVALTSESSAEIHRLMRGLACDMAGGRAPVPLAGKRLLTLDPGALLAGSKYRGQLEERLKQLLREVREAGDILLACHSLGDLVDLERKAIGSPFRLALQEGLVQVIAGALPGEIDYCRKADPALTECFVAVPVAPLSREEALRGLYEVRDRYAAHHGVTYSDEALTAILKAAEPGDPAWFWQRALDLLDDVGARLRLEGHGGGRAATKDIARSSKNDTSLKK